MVAVPSPLSVKVDDGGGENPLVENAGVGVPVVVNVKLKGSPVMAVADAALVKVGALASATVSVKSWVNPGMFTPVLCADTAWYVPGVCTVPDIVAVPSPLSTKLTPAGKAGTPRPTPESVRFGIGAPLDVTMKLNGTPVTTLTLEGLLIPGSEGGAMVSKTLSLASGSIPSSRSP